MDIIKEELSGYAMELAPSDLPPNTQVRCWMFFPLFGSSNLKLKPVSKLSNCQQSFYMVLQVPFLSVGNDVGGGGRHERCRGRSEVSGEFVVEDVDVNGDLYRRLVFFNNPKLIQSESRIFRGLLHSCWGALFKFRMSLSAKRKPAAPRVSKRYPIQYCPMLVDFSDRMRAGMLNIVKCSLGWLALSTNLDLWP